MAENNRMAVGGNIMPSPRKPMAPEQSDGSVSKGSDAIPSKPMAPDQSDGSGNKCSDAIPSKPMAHDQSDRSESKGSDAMVEDVTDATNLTNDPLGENAYKGSTPLALLKTIQSKEVDTLIEQRAIEKLVIPWWRMSACPPPGIPQMIVWGKMPMKEELHWPKTTLLNQQDHRWAYLW